MPPIQRNHTMPATSDPATRRFAIRVALLYAILGGAWILLSDKMVMWLTNDPGQIALFSTLKGQAFIAVSALALWLLLRRGIEQRSEPANEDQEDTARRPLLSLLPVLAAGLAILALTAAGIFHTVRQQEDLELARLHAIANLKARQIADWLRERQDDANFIARSRHLAETYQHWHARRDAARGERLRSSLREFIQYNGFHNTQVLNTQGESVAWDSEALPGAISPNVRAAIGRARAERKPVHVGPYRDADNRLHLDFVAPLLTLGAEAGPVIVLHVDLLAGLFPMLQTWPGPSPSGEIVWFRRDGGDVLYLNELRHRTDTAAKLRQPLEKNQTLAAQVLHGTVKPGQAVKGVDYRGVPVFGVVHAVPGDDWFLLAKLDQSELYAGAYRDAVWVSLAGLLALFTLVAGVYLSRQQRELAIAKQVRQSQTERLRALHLLAAIADSSDDAIFAKDLAGHFILFNRASQRITGQTQEQALGHDETALFPPDLARQQLADNREVMDNNIALTFQEDITTPDGTRTFLTTKGPLHDSAGRIIGLYGIARDITTRKNAEESINQQAEELARRNAELERFNSAMVGRELDMITLKRRVNALSSELGREAPYPMSFLDTPE